MNEIEFSEMIAKELYTRSLTEWKTVKGLIFPRLRNTKWNKDELAHIPHREIADLSVTYLIGPAENGLPSLIEVTDKLSDTWGVTEEDLYKAALGAVRHSNPVIMEIGEVIRLQGGIPDERDGMPKMLTLAYEGFASYGAAAILLPETADMLGRLIGDEYLLIPSSVHEWIAVAEKDIASREDAIIREINEACVAPSDRLSDHAYRYDKKLGLVAA